MIDFKVGDRIRIVQGIYRKEDFQAEVIRLTPTRVYYRRGCGYEHFFAKKDVDGVTLKVESVCTEKCFG